MTIKIPIAEVFLSGVSVWWAIVLFANANMLNNRLPSYMSEFSVVQEYIWACVFLTGAGVKIIGLITLSLPARKIGLIISMILYSIITTGYILSDQLFHTGTGVYFLLTVLAWWGFREVKENDEPIE